jgi:uncharacterized protein (DUF305 family)
MARQRLIRSLVAATVAVVTLSACTINVNMPGSSSPSEPTTSFVGAFDHRDLMFAEMMIPHHEQALEMSELVLENSTNESVRDLAQRIISGQNPEINQMQAWLDANGGAGGHHVGHGMGNMDTMGGMASEAELALLATLSSPDFDVLFLELMIDHHEGAIDMVRMIRNSSNDEVRALAEQITRVQREEIAEMRELLDRL